MATKKEISGFIKLQIKGGQANPAPPVGPALGQRGVNIMEFCKAFNDKTKSMAGKPVPVSDKEIEKILGQIKDGVAQPKSGIEYSIGEKVQVVDGPFASFSGMVEDIDEEKSRLKVSVSIFGRPTPVDLEYNQVEKVS